MINLYSLEMHNMHLQLLSMIKVLTLKPGLQILKYVLWLSF